MAQIEGIDIERDKQSTVRLSASGVVVFIDPWQISEDKGKVDIILITHDHFDHCDPDSVEALRKQDTVVIGPESCSSRISGLRVASPGDVVEEKGIKIEAIDAYNINKSFHQKGKCLGYVVTLAGKRIYHAGDTDRIPEMKNLTGIDIALLPVGGTYTMTTEEAAAAINEDIKPKTAIPMHYGDVVGSTADAEKFKELCSTEVKII